MRQSATQTAEVQSVLFPDLFDREVCVAFDAEEQSSDGGALLLAGVERQLQVIGALAEAPSLGGGGAFFSSLVDCHSRL